MSLTPKRSRTVIPPTVESEPESEEGGETNRQRIRRIGRNALIQTSPQGILGSPSSSRRQLTA